MVVKHKKGKLSDLAGVWKISDEEAEEIKAAIRAAWKCVPADSKEG